MKMRYLLATISFAGACTVGNGSASSQVRDSLEGVWSVRWDLEQPSRRAGQAPLRSDTRGRLALLRSIAGAPPADVPGGHVTHIGTYQADFDSLGVSMRLNDFVPVSQGRVFSNDSVEVVLNPHTDHGAIIMAGLRNGDSIVGQWRHSDAGGMAGTFIMRKVP